MRALSTLLTLAAAAAAVTFEALPGTVNLLPLGHTDVAFRHCDYVASTSPYEVNNDFIFKPVAALNGNANAVSFQSTNYDTMYVTIVGGQGLQATRLGIQANPNTNDASFVLTPSGPSGYFTVATQSTANPGLITMGTTNTGSCAASGWSDVYIAAAGQGVAQTWLVGQPPPPPPPPAATLVVNATAPANKMNPWFMGCHSDPGYVQEPRGWYSQLVYGESFEQGTTKVFAWNDITAASANAVVQLDPAVNVNPNKIVPSLSIAYTGGSGVAGWANRGIGNEGLYLVGGSPYEGYAVVLAPSGGQFFFGLNDHVNGVLLDSVTITVPASADWQVVNFTLTPSAGTTCVGIAPGSDATVDCGGLGPNAGHICVKCGGEVQVGLAAPASVHVGYVYFGPGPWGRVGDLPVLKSAADTMAAMGITIIRQGGTVSQSFAWKEWRGVPWQRGSMQHVWQSSLVSGWGPFEFFDMCAALGIEPVITLAEDLNNATDWADLVEYLYGDATTHWGNIRINVDGHPDTFAVHTFELGNEQYNNAWISEVTAMEAKRAEIGAPPLWYMFPTNQGLSAADQAKAQAAGLPINMMGPDCHVGGGGGVECAEAVWSASPNFPQGAINCETNDVLSTFERAMHESADLQDWFNVREPNLSRLRARTASFCAERSGHYDYFDQGITFFLPNMTWLQPPGYVHAMITQTWQNNSLGVTVSGGGGGFPSASAQLSDDGATAVVQVVNPVGSANTTSLTITFEGFTPATSVTVWTLAAPMSAASGLPDPNAANTPANPTGVSPVRSQISWPAGATSSVVTIQPMSFTIFQFTSA